MNTYADTNFLVRLYLSQPESERAIALAERVRVRRAQPLPVTWLHRAEVCNAIQLYVFRGRSPNNLRVTAEQASAAWADFRAELRSPGLLQVVAIPGDDLEQQFEALSFRYTPRHGFRTYDVLHVASALALGCDTFWSFDAKASRLAQLEGLALGHSAS
jgi:predicted nucleic acid-binding protein